MLFKRI